MKQSTILAVLLAATALLALAGAGCVAARTGSAGAGAPWRELTPADDIQKALDAAAPGDTIVLKPGMYYQNLHITRGGKPGKPVTLRAAQGGTATLSGAMPPAGAGTLKFERLEGDLYRASSSTSRVWWVMAGERNLLNYGTLDNLKKFEFPNLYSPSNALHPCIAEGFAWQDDALYIRLEGGADPGAAAIEVNRRGGYAISVDPEVIFYCAPDTGFQVPGAGHMFSASLANITVRADHVVIEGLRLRLGVGASVLVYGNEVSIRDCYMTGAHLGVFQPDALQLPVLDPPRPVRHGNRTARGLTVEYCEFSGYPAYQWDRRDQKYWDALYHSNIAATFMNYGGPRSIVRHNWSYECFDGLEPRGNGTDSPADASELAYNVIQNSADDSIEFDSATAMNLRVHHNVIMDGLCLFSLCPVLGGGLTIDHNILYVSPEHGLDWCVLMKLGSPWGSARPTQGMRIFQNTMVNTKRWIYWCGEEHRYEDNLLENNIFYCAYSRGWGMRNFAPTRHNLYCGPRIETNDIPEMMHYDGSPFVSTNPVSFFLRADSPAVDAGAAGQAYHHQPRGKAPDLGAIELGDTWEFPRPGPRWASGSEISNRPAIPASLPPKWVGLE